MNGKRLCTLGFLVASILAFVLARADEGETPAPSGGDTPATAPAAEEAKKPFKQRWKEYWGPFALYLETGVGTGSTDTIESSMSTSGGPGSINVTDIDLLTGYFWTPPPPNFASFEHAEQKRQKTDSL